jgi:hypothetical protein
MKNIRIQNGSRYNKSEKIKNLLAALSQYGKVEAEYFKGRLFLARILFGKGQPKSVEEEDNKWNQVKISYQERNAIEFLFSDWGCEGIFFDENFAENETQQIITAITQAEVLIQNKYLVRMKWTRAVFILGILLGSLAVVGDIMAGDTLLQMSPHLFVVFGFLFFLSRT